MSTSSVGSLLRLESLRSRRRKVSGNGGSSSAKSTALHSTDYVVEPLAVPGPPTRATRTLKQDLHSSRTKSSTTRTKINHHVQPHLQRKIIAHVGDEVEGHGHERPQQAHSELRNASPADSPAELDEDESGSVPAVRLVPDEDGAGKQLPGTTRAAANHENNHPRRRGIIDQISTPDSSCSTTALPETDDVTTDIPSGETFCTGSTTSTSQSSTPIPTRQEASELEDKGMNRVVVSTSEQMNEKKSEDDVLDPAMAIESELLRWIASCEEQQTSPSATVVDKKKRHREADEIKTQSVEKEPTSSTAGSLSSAALTAAVDTSAKEEHTETSLETKAPLEADGRDELQAELIQNERPSSATEDHDGDKDLRVAVAENKSGKNSGATSGVLENKMDRQVRIGKVARTKDASAMSSDETSRPQPVSKHPLAGREAKNRASSGGGAAAATPTTEVSSTPPSRQLLEHQRFSFASELESLAEADRARVANVQFLGGSEFLVSFDLITKSPGSRRTIEQPAIKNNPPAAPGDAVVVKGAPAAQDVAASPPAVTGTTTAATSIMLKVYPEKYPRTRDCFALRCIEDGAEFSYSAQSKMASSRLNPNVLQDRVMRHHGGVNAHLVARCIESLLAELDRITSDDRKNPVDARGASGARGGTKTSAASVSCTTRPGQSRSGTQEDERNKEKEEDSDGNGEDEVQAQDAELRLEQWLQGGDLELEAVGLQTLDITQIQAILAARSTAPEVEHYQRYVPRKRRLFDENDKDEGDDM
ncbi:unnamed protein product [Amoebophrya sp. A120]|nr:unnamed protein product [Amoebophrya sp. A120]|eukprot:GSA120T00025815001.1